MYKSEIYFQPSLFTSSGRTTNSSFDVALFSNAQTQLFLSDAASSEKCSPTTEEREVYFFFTQVQLQLVLSLLSVCTLLKSLDSPGSDFQKLTQGQRESICFMMRNFFMIDEKVLKVFAQKRAWYFPFSEKRAKKTLLLGLACSFNFVLWLKKKILEKWIKCTTQRNSIRKSRF